MSKHNQAPFLITVANDEDKVTVQGLQSIHSMFSVDENKERIRTYKEGKEVSDKTYKIVGDDILLPIDPDSRINKYLIMGTHAKDSESDHFESLGNIELLEMTLKEFGEDPKEILNGTKQEIVEKLNSLPKDFFSKLAKNHILQVAKQKGLKILNLDEVDDIKLRLTNDGQIALEVGTPIMATPIDSDFSVDSLEDIQKLLKNASKAVVTDKEDVIALRNAFKEYIPELDTDNFELDEIDILKDGINEGNMKTVEKLLNIALKDEGIGVKVTQGTPYSGIPDMRNSSSKVDDVLDGLIKDIKAERENRMVGSPDMSNEEIIDQARKFIEDYEQEEGADPEKVKRMYKVLESMELYEMGGLDNQRKAVELLREQVRQDLINMGVDVNEIDKQLEEELKEFTDINIVRVPNLERIRGLSKIFERKMKENNLTFDDYRNPKPPVKEENDLVNHPSHYQRDGRECIDVIESILSPAEFRGFLKGNMMKYDWRAGLKEGSSKEQDLAKAKWYDNKLNEFNEKQLAKRMMRNKRSKKDHSDNNKR